MTKKLWVCDAQGHYKFHNPPKDNHILELASEILKKRIKCGDVFDNPETAGKFLCCRIGKLEHEVFCCLFFDNRHRLIIFEEMFRGTISGATVHPREVAKRALELNAAAVIFGHNHPSGIPEPSTSDKSITKKLVGCLDLFDIRVLDHIVVGGHTYVSFSDCGFM